MFRAYGYPELAHGFRLSLEVSGLRPTTIRNYTADARKFVEHYLDVPPSEVTPMHIRQYLALLKKRVSAKTVYEAQLALRKFFRFLVEEGGIAGSPCDGIKLTRYRVDPQPFRQADEGGIGLTGGSGIERLRNLSSLSLRPGNRFLHT